jgi:polyhydroxyalkanoate synthase
VKFVLGGSGHIAGVVNPPSKNKYGYWTNETLPADANEWFSSANKNEGSWWQDWDQWLEAYKDGWVAARKPGSGSLSTIEDAPGSYVKLRLVS